MNAPLLEPNHRILVIDDNAAIHDDFRKILGAVSASSTGLEEAEAALFGAAAPASSPQVCFEIDSAFQGQEGLTKVQKALAEKRPYALAFVDVRMPPGWDGIETITHLWKHYPDLQVVICTAYSDYSWDEIAQQLGQSDSLVILKKPFDNVEVLQLAHALTKKWLLSQQAKDRLENLDQLVRERTGELQVANEKLRREMAQREEMEQALRLSEERFVKAFQASPIPMAILSFPGLRHLDVNASFMALTGYRREELVHRTADELELEAAPSLVMDRLARISELKSLRHLEGKVRTKAGEVRDVLWSVELFELGVEPHLLVIAQDITDRLRLEGQLRQAQRMEAIGQLSAGIAHDFNNILTVIQGHASLVLARTSLEKEIEDSLREVAHAAERAATLTRQLLAYSRKQAMHFQVLQVNERLRPLSRMLRRLIGEHIRLRYEFAESLPAVMGDLPSLEQVITNLAVNARDAMPEGGETIIRTSQRTLDEGCAQRNPEARPGHFVCIEVIDNGAGMSAEVCSRVFEPFFTTKEIGKGTGLGLASSYGILKQHQGWIEVESELGRGSTFTVFLPVAESAAAAAADPPPLAASSAGGHESILVVEDEGPVRELSCQILERAGYAVYPAANGQEALKAWTAAKGRIDLLVTDMVMPEGVSGRSLAETLWARHPELKVIFTSGYSSEMIEAQPPHPSRCRFLAKPYPSSVLIHTVRQCLDERAPQSLARFGPAVMFG